METQMHLGFRKKLVVWYLLKKLIHYYIGGKQVNGIFV